MIYNNLMSVNYSIIDTLHVYLVGDMFKNILIFGRFSDHVVSANMPWFGLNATFLCPYLRADSRQLLVISLLYLASHLFLNV